MEKIFENFTVNILKLNKLVGKIKQFEMEPYGLKAVHVMCGYYLYQNPDGLTASELTKLTIEDKGAISRALALMREKGLVNYDAHTYNSTVTLTSDGKRFAEEVLQKADNAVLAGCADQTEEERRVFYKTLSDIVDNLTAYCRRLTGKK